MRASIVAEKLGLPTVSIVCGGFELQGEFTAAGSGMSNLPMAVYPGHVHFHSVQELEDNIKTVMVEQIVKGLTVQPKETKLQEEPGPKDIVLEGTFEEVNEFFYSNEWGDGLPVIPPTAEKVEDFLKYTEKSADEVIAQLLPDNREATVWSIAVNGVMAGCRPEYMPVLIAIIEAMADPNFGQEHLGHTPGTEVLITINGPIIKDLGFNYEQGALRVGFQANTSIGRFWRLYLRNVAGFLPHKTDKATFGGTWRVVLAENEEAVAKIGWEPMSVDQGFKAGDNVVTISSCTSTDSLFSAGAVTAEQILNKIAVRVVDNQMYLFAIVDFLGPSIRPQIILSPAIAEQIAKGGYSKDGMKQYLYEHAKFPAERFERLRPDYVSLCDAVKEGKLPQQYCQSDDPDRLVPIVWSPDDFMITVSGDPARDNCFLCAENGFIGYPVSKKIELPLNWKELLRSR
ncbi:UGSC family (seleno)protein [Chloroflexota bacterium]